MTNLKFKESLQVEIVEPDNVFLISETDYYLLTGSLYKKIAPLLNGQNSSADIIEALGSQVPPPHLIYALNQLQARGYIVEVDDSLPTEQAAFWQTMNISVPTANDQLAQTSVSLHAVGSATTQRLQDALIANGVQLAERGELQIVLTDDYLQPDLAEFNEQATQDKQSWLPAKVIGEMIWIGPLIVPDETACWECMATRIRINRPVEAFISRQRKGKEGTTKRVTSALQATEKLGANLLATEITKWVVGGEITALNGRLMTLNTLTMETEFHDVTRRPQCPVCGTPELYRPDREPMPIELQPSPKKFTMDGGHRTLSPEEAFEHHRHLISPITGVVTHLFNTMTETEGLAYSYIAGHDFGTSEHSVAELYQTLQGRSSGKGMTKSQAKMSAIGEAVERYSTVYRGTHEITIRATYEDIADDAIFPNDVWLFSEEQYKNRATWNPQQKSSYHIVPKPFPTDKAFAWAPFWSLTNNTFKYYPAFSTYFNHPDLYQGHGPSHSNGCAAGSTLEEAIYQGFLELVERDSIAIWWYNRLRYPRVDLDSFDNPYTRELEEFYAAQKRSMWVIDITADLGIPTFVAISGRLDNDPEDIIVGMGSHLDPHIALLRSLSELNQFLANVYFKNPDGTTRYLNNVQETVEWHKTAKLENNLYLKPSDHLPPRKLSDFPKLHSDDLAEDLRTCVKLLQNAGLEMLAVDVSQPDVSIKSCRVLVPGLRHFWRRLGPGRLYDVPIKLGLLDTPTAENDLNPISMFF